MTSHSKNLLGAAVTSVARATTGTIKNTTGKDCTIVAIDAVALPLLTTVVNSGGLVELENDATDIIPCHFCIGGATAVGTGAVDLVTETRKVNLPFPRDSVMTVYYNPDNAVSQKLSITLHFIDSAFSGRKTRMMGKRGPAITQLTIAADHVTIDVPAEKGGRLRRIETIVYGVTTTVVNSGGLVALKNVSASVSWEPTEFISPGGTCITSGAHLVSPYIVPVDLHLPSGSKVQLDYTPQNALSQRLGLTIVWE